MEGVSGRESETVHERVMWHVKGKDAVEIIMPMIQEGKKKEGRKVGERQEGWWQVIKYLLYSVFLLEIFSALSTGGKCDYSNVTKMITKTQNFSIVAKPPQQNIAEAG